MRYFQQIENRPSQFLIHVGKIIDSIFIFLKFDSERRSFFRYFESNRFSINLQLPPATSNLKIDLLFVAARKDLETFPLAAFYAFQSVIGGEVQQISVIAPQKDVRLFENVIGSTFLPINVIDEESIISSATIIQLKEIYSNRFGWVLQQIIKLRFVENSNADGVLVVDADTILLKKRKWLDYGEKQILTPTWEFHRPYYNFLNSLNICSQIPTYTFVPHHMLMQPKIVSELISHLGWEKDSDLLKSIKSVDLPGENSPFSIDYELYAQYMFKNYPELLTLEKWANLSLARSKHGFGQQFKRLLPKVGKSFASLSFHSYL